MKPKSDQICLNVASVRSRTYPYNTSSALDVIRRPGKKPWRFYGALSRTSCDCAPMIWVFAPECWARLRSRWFARPAFCLPSLRQARCRREAGLQLEPEARRCDGLSVVLAIRLHGGYLRRPLQGVALCVSRPRLSLAATSIGRSYLCWTTSAARSRIAPDLGRRAVED